MTEAFGLKPLDRDVMLFQHILSESWENKEVNAEAAASWLLLLAFKVASIEGP